jgi:hypothetical protein
MAKITVGNISEDARAIVNVDTPPASNLDLTIGHVMGRAKLDLSILERDGLNVAGAIAELQKQVLALADETMLSAPLRKEAQEIVSAATKMVKEKHWYSVSLGGLFEAAKAVGEAASPIVASALKVLELLQKAKI